MGNGGDIGNFFALLSSCTPSDLSPSLATGQLTTKCHECKHHRRRPALVVSHHASSSSSWRPTLAMNGSGVSAQQDEDKCVPRGSKDFSPSRLLSLRPRARARMTVDHCIRCLPVLQLPAYPQLACDLDTLCKSWFIWVKDKHAYSIK